MKGKKRITTIVLDEEADLKSKMMAEYYDMPLAAIWRRGIDILFDQFVINDLHNEITKLDSLYFAHGYYAGNEFSNAIKLIDNQQYDQAAMIISAQLSRLQDKPEYEELVSRGMKLVHLLSMK